MLELNEIQKAMREVGKIEKDIAEAIDAIVDLRNIVMNENMGKAATFNAPAGRMAKKI